VGDTKNGGTNTTIDAVTVTVHAGPSGTGTAVSDLYILDTAGTYNNSWLGDMAVRVLSPTGNGTYSQLTNSAATQVNNYSYVDELPPSATDYVGAQAGSGLIDTYQLADVPPGIPRVHGIQVNTVMAKSDAHVALARTRFRANGTDYLGASKALSTTYQEFSELREMSPVTSQPWTVGGVNEIEVGAQVL
jgi:hypothetical protein